MKWVDFELPNLPETDKGQTDIMNLIKAYVHKKKDNSSKCKLVCSVIHLTSKLIFKKPQILQNDTTVSLLCYLLINVSHCKLHS